MFYTKGTVDIKNSDFLTKHVCCPGDVMLKMSLFHFGNILWLFLKGNATSLLSIININDLTGHVFTLLLSRKQYEPELEQLNALQRRLNGTVLRDVQALHPFQDRDLLLEAFSGAITFNVRVYFKHYIPFQTQTIV